MRKPLLLLFAAIIGCSLSAQETGTGTTSNKLRFGGQLSAWGYITPDLADGLWLGARALPRLNYTIDLGKNRSIDFEVSGSVYGEAGYDELRLSDNNGDINFYRAWARYSGNRTEIKLGLQRISFGTSRMFRPLMWFDKVDPRDPLEITNGVWGGLFRYNFPNEANVWLWGLGGNVRLRAWDFARSAGKLRPEVGGRVQYPLPFGAVGVSYHYRQADFDFMKLGDLSESRFGFDLRADMEVGLWLEASWTQYNKEIGNLTNQQLITLGSDYIFDVGNGVTTTVEHLLYGSDYNPFEFKDAMNFTGVSFSYPLTLLDDLSAMVYYDWKDSNVYTFCTWKRQVKSLSYYVMGYWNPKNSQMPGQASGSRLLGKGLQLMVAWDF